MKNIKVIVLFLSLTGLLLPFQNCGSDFNPEEYSNQSSLGSGGPIAPPAVSQSPQIASLSSPGTVGYFEAALLGVSASGSNLSYQWYKDNVLLSGATGSTYSIANATDSHKGNYYVVVSNAFGSVTSAMTNLNVVRLPNQTAPAIISKTPTQVLPFFADTSVPLSVTATGYNLTYSWSILAYDVNGVLVNTPIPNSNSNQIMSQKTSYVVNGVTYYYATIGTYRVVVTNAFGETATADIIVEFEPLNFGGGGFSGNNFL